MEDQALEARGRGLTSFAILPKFWEISGIVPERIQADGRSETQGPRRGGTRTKGGQGTFQSGRLIFLWGKFR